MAKITNDQLRPYGYVPGNLEGWCAACTRTSKNFGEGGFKCRPCAHGQAMQVNHECRAVGWED